MVGGGYGPKYCFLDKYFMHVLTLFGIFVYVEDFYLSKIIFNFLLISVFCTDSFNQNFSIKLNFIG